MRDQYVIVLRELLLRLLSVYSTSPYPAWHELAAALEADPAEDFRAVGEEPAYLFTDEQGMPGWTDRWDVAKHLPYDVEKVYRHPQRPVEPQCSEVTAQCSEHLRTQGRAVVLPESTEIDFLIERPAK